MEQFQARVEAERLARETATQMEAERTLLISLSQSAAVLLSVVVSAVAMFLLQALPAPSYVHIMLAVAIALIVVSAVEIWIMRKRLDAAIALVQMTGSRRCGSR